MADEQEVHPEKVRKTVSLTHRQIGATGLVGLAVALAPYLKETFITRAEGIQVVTEMQALHQQVTDLKELVNNNSERIINEIGNSEKRTGKNEDRLERRIENLEVYAFEYKRKSSSTK